VRVELTLRCSEEVRARAFLSVSETLFGLRDETGEWTAAWDFDQSQLGKILRQMKRPLNHNCNLGLRGRWRAATSKTTRKDARSPCMLSAYPA